MASFMNYQRKPDVNETANIKQHLKNTFALLLWTHFGALKPILTTSPEVVFQTDPNVSGLHIYKKFPNVQRQLPAIAVSLRGLSGTRKTLKQDMSVDYIDHIPANAAEFPNDGEHHRNVQGFDVSGFVQFDIMALSNGTRDELIDRLVDFFIWRGENPAKLDSKVELRKRWIDFDVDNYALSGDQEMPLEEGTGDLVYTDGLAIPFIAEMYHFGSDQVPLEVIKTTINSV